MVLEIVFIIIIYLFILGDFYNKIASRAWRSLLSGLYTVRSMKICGGRFKYKRNFESFFLITNPFHIPENIKLSFYLLIIFKKKTLLLYLSLKKKKNVEKVEMTKKRERK